MADDYELGRVLDLPVVDPEELENAWLVWSVLLRRHPGAPFLRMEQGAILASLAKAPMPYGVFASAGVGSGKSLVALLAGHVTKAKRPLILCPPGLESELRLQYEEWKEHYPLVLPKVLAYSRLSRPEGATAIDTYRPDLIVCDEIQALKLVSSARTKRFRRYLKENPTTVRVLGMSGTMTGGDLEDMAFHLKATLRDRAPIPLRQGAVDVWAAVIDPDGFPDPAERKALEPLRKWSGKRDWEEAFFARLVATPGVICSREASIDIPLVIRKHKTKTSPGLKEALDRLKADWVTPDGEALLDTKDLVRYARNLAAGFYYRLGPAPSPEWEEARREWGRHLRVLLEYRSRRGFDSPLLVETALRESTAPSYAEAKEALLLWDTFREQRRPPTEVVWLDDKPLRGFVEQWVEKNQTGLLWFRSRAVRDLLKDMGLDVRAGGDAPPRNEPLAAVQVDRFNAGFNLQYGRSTMAVLEPLANAIYWDQLIARVHRPGQTAPVVTCDIFLPAWPYDQALDKATKKAASIAKKTGSKHRLLLADYKEED